MMMNDYEYLMNIFKTFGHSVVRYEHNKTKLLRLRTPIPLTKEDFICHLANEAPEPSDTRFTYDSPVVKHLSRFRRY